MLTLSSLYVYPIKSLAGISVPTATVTARGLAHDRRYMLVDHDNQFITIRKYPRMTLLQPQLTDSGLTVFDRTKRLVPLDIVRPGLAAGSGRRVEVTVWGDRVDALEANDQINRWFSEALDINCKLVYMPEESERPVTTYAGELIDGTITSFSDAYPYLMIGEASLRDLNNRIGGGEVMEMSRFRPNLVFTGGEAYEEDRIRSFTINAIPFRGQERCARCGVPNVDPSSGRISGTGEPVKTLMGYRKENGKIFFGQNVVSGETGRISVGDVIVILL